MTGVQTCALPICGVFFEQNQDNTHLGLPFTQQILMSEFAHRAAINGGETLRNGYPNVWSNDAVILHQKRRTAPAETTQSFLKRAVRWMR